MSDTNEEAIEEELRIAVVMNGGVSLAIWIGGVSLELNRLTRSRRGASDVYARLCELVHCVPRVDVIAGSSAGGLNGGFLALAAAYDRPLDALADVWADNGGLLDLLRAPMDPDPPSLLRGDDYFLPELRKAYDKIAPPWLVGSADIVPPADAPLTLVMTTSVLNGQLREYRDDFGSQVREIDHKGQFRFERGRQARTDPFAESTITARLALASRSTASFPVAFEPSYVPVGKDAETDALHPDMDGHTTFTRSRYVLDGGVLVNKPMAPALDAIAAQSAERQVRRVLAYVVPDPGLPTEAEPDVRAEMPTVAKVLADALVSLPRAESIAAELEEIRARNRRARDRRVAAADLAGPLGRGELADLANALFPTYQTVRARRAVGNISDIVGPMTAPAATNGPPPWSYEELLVAFGADEETMRERLPFVPAEFTLDADPWDWGLAPSERAGFAALDLLRRAAAVAPARPALLATLGRYRGEVHERAETLRALRKGDTDFWQARAKVLGPPPADAVRRRTDLAAWADESIELWPVAEADPRESAADVAQRRDQERDAILEVTAQLVDSLVAAAPAVFEAVAADSRAADKWTAEEAHRVELIARGLGLDGGDSPETRRTCWHRLFELDVVQLSMNGRPPEPLEPIDLVQVSGDTPNGFGGPQSTATKLAGVQLGHFGAFYKRSWRINDWTWGRIDGATRLVQILLDPTRLRRLYNGQIDTLVKALREIAIGSDDDLAALWDRDLKNIERELAYLADPKLEPPPALTTTAFAVARRLHADILEKELPRLAQAVRVDQSEGAGVRGAGAAFASAYNDAGSGLGAATRLKLFAGAHIASEHITGEAGTDLFARTAGKAAAVAVATADSKRSGLGPARALTRTLRGFTLLLYALVASGSRGSRVGAWFVNAMLATGGALLAVTLLTYDAKPIVKTLAAALVLAGLAYAALRSKAWLLAVVLGFPLSALVALLYAPGGWATIRRHQTPVLVIAALVVAMMAIGSVRLAGRDPLVLRLPTWLLLVVLCAGAAATVAAFLWMQHVASPGMVRLEVLSPTRARALHVIARWQAQHGGLARGRAYVVRDFAFLAAYWIPLATLAVLVGRWLRTRRPGTFRYRLGTFAATFAWVAIYASALDAVENVTLLAQLHEVGHGFGLPAYLPVLTTVVSAWKWVLIAAVAVYVVGGAAVQVQPWPKGGRPKDAT